jgi:hypothetical protein
MEPTEIDVLRIELSHRIGTLEAKVDGLLAAVARVEAILPRKLPPYRRDGSTSDQWRR